jgi:periplasmic divalent cation tolerance protein
MTDITFCQGEYLVVLVTAPDLEIARQLAKQALTERLAACVQILPGLESHYWWDNQITQGQEILVLFKTTRDQWPLLAARIRELHPFDVPQIVAVPIESGFTPYLNWIRLEVTGAKEPKEGASW